MAYHLVLAYPQGQPYHLLGKQTVQNDPQRIQVLATELQNAIQTGELQADQVNMGLQLAQSAVQDPNLYPQLREFAITNGLAEQADLPMEYDEGLIFMIILACKLALGMPVPGMGQPMEQGIPSMRAVGRYQKKALTQVVFLSWPTKVST